MRLTVDSRQLPVGWIKTKLGDVCKKVEYGSSAKSKPEGEIPVLRMGNIQNGVIDWNDLVYTTDQEEIDKYLLKYNDILFNRTNSAEHVGKTAIYKSERPAIFAGYLIRIHRKEDLIDADFLNYYLNSNSVREYGKSVMSHSVNQANINGTKLKEYPIILPPLPEQKRIVAILDEAFEGIDRAIANTEKNLANSRELFESYLNAIFTQKGDGWVEKTLGDICDFLNSYVDKKFLLHLLRSKSFLNALYRSSRGVRQANLSSLSIKKILISLPPVEIQKLLVSEFRALEAETKRLEAIYRKKIAALNELKQSILQKAFTGELTVRLSSPTTADTPKTVKEEIAA